MEIFYAIGAMSGTSCDGLDVALCYFDFLQEKSKFKIIKAKTYDYNTTEKKKLLDLSSLSSEELKQADVWFANLVATKINEFITDIKYPIDIIASHGHTVFHNPDHNYTLQIGDGNVIAKQTGIKTIYDFRSGDVALGGQGAPLVPIGDDLLFANYDACLNIGGFANISSKIDNNRIAYDICPANIILNHYARKLNLEYDKNGNIAAQNDVDINLKEQLNKLDYYTKNPPKSLGREWVEKYMLPLIDNSNCKNLYNIIATLTHHIAEQIANCTYQNNNILVTGGGANNSTLIGLIEKKSNAKLYIPEQTIIDYKEALIFALLGILRLKGENNCYAKYTGASKDSCCGVIALP